MFASSAKLKLHSLQYMHFLILIVILSHMGQGNGKNIDLERCNFKVTDITITLNICCYHYLP